MPVSAAVGSSNINVTLHLLSLLPRLLHHLSFDEQQEWLALLVQLVLSPSPAAAAVHLSSIKLLFCSVQAIAQHEQSLPFDALWHEILEPAVLDLQDKQVHAEGMRLLEHFAQAPCGSPLHAECLSLLAKMADLGCPTRFAEAWIVLRHYASSDMWTVLPFLDPQLPPEPPSKQSKAVGSRLLQLYEKALGTMEQTEIEAMQSRLLVHSSFPLHRYFSIHQAGVCRCGFQPKIGTSRLGGSTFLS